MKRPLPAAAEQPVPDAPQRWYGGQVVIADGLSVGLIVAGLAIASNGESDSGSERSSVVLSSLGLVGYLAGASVVHGFHDRPALRVLASLGLRVGAPVVGAGLGTVLANCGSSNDSFSDGFCEVGAAGLGVVVGMLVAMVIDAALSFEPVEPVTTGIALAPALRVEQGRTIGGVVGRF